MTEHFYACASQDGTPLGYVRAVDLDAAMAKARARWGDRFANCHRWDGVL